MVNDKFDHGTLDLLLKCDDIHYVAVRGVALLWLNLNSSRMLLNLKLLFNIFTVGVSLVVSSPVNNFIVNDFSASDFWYKVYTDRKSRPVWVERLHEL